MRFQRHILAFVGWLLLTVVVPGTAGFVALGTEEGIGDWIPARARFGTVFSLISLGLPVLVRRCSGDISRIHGLKGQYVAAAVVTALMPAAAGSFMWWASLPAALVALVSLVMTDRVEKLPAEQTTETIDYLEPAGTEELGPGFFGGLFGFVKAIVLGLLFGIALIVGVTLLGPEPTAPGGRRRRHCRVCDTAPDACARGEETPLTRLSHLDAERDLQKYIIVFLGWAGIALVILGVAGLAFGVEEVAGDADGPGQWVPFRAVMGAVAVLISLRLPLLVRRHREGISRIDGMKRQYLTAAVVTAVLPVPGSAFFWWAALPASAVGLVSLVLAARVPKIPVEEMTETIDYRNPEAWGGPTFLGDRFVFLKVMAISFVLTSALVIALILFAT